jgi:catechol 2,3-dioxygenase-like lactoylglutathione lyase family enzyme
MRSADGRPIAQVTERGEPRMIGFAFEAAGREDLDILAKLPGASAVEARGEPGGGERVVLREPNGYMVEVVHGLARDPPAILERAPMNTAAEPLRRVGALMRPDTGPATVVRIAHVVLGTPKVEETVAWFRQTLGLIASDDVYNDDGSLFAAFSRLDRGDEYVDHHVLFCASGPTAGLNHVSFEVADLDDLFLGHEHLRGLDLFDHVWGVGRHLLGSNIFDYWADPWGRIYEHWSDTDRLKAADGGSRHLLRDGVMRGIWGEAIPERFRNHVSP